MISPSLYSVTDEELNYIAALDYGQDKERHLEALRKIFTVQSGNLSADQNWFPYEVIELGSNSFAPGHEREFFFCTMLVIQSALSGYDTAVDLNAKLSDHAHEYDRLPSTQREEVLSAYQQAGA